MRILKLALAALVIVALGAPTIGSAVSSGGGPVAAAAKKCKGKKGSASAAKKKKCGSSKKKGGDGSPAPVKPTGDTQITLSQYRTNFPVAGQDEIKATVTSTNGACQGGRQLTLFEELGAVDQVVDTAPLAASVAFFGFASQNSGDAFYAVATQDTVGSVSCSPGTSNLFSKP